LFLDQDDEIIPDKFITQFSKLNESDVIVGNMLYQYGANIKQIYQSVYVMKYLIQKKLFLCIRNLIPSPGGCLIRRDALPKAWIENPISANGADDWLLWILMFVENKRFTVNPNIVFFHKDANGQNLSLDIHKMYKSSLEIYRILMKTKSLSESDINILKRSIEFKYHWNMKENKLLTMLRYPESAFANILYKINLLLISMVYRTRLGAI
jgi:hypothetical protein